MKKRTMFCLGACLILLATLVCLFIRFKKDEKGRFIPWGVTVDIKEHPEVLSSLRDIQPLKVLEGFPHHYNEAEIFKQEIENKASTKLHKFHFYPDIIDVSNPDAIAIRSVLSSKGTVREWSGLKLCGGYHPDYALIWTDKRGQEFEALVCFGCSEIRFYTDGVKLYTDMSMEAHKALRPILANYGGKRPKMEIEE